MSVGHIILFSGKIKRTSRTFKLKSDELTCQRSWSFVNALSHDTILHSILTKTEHCHVLKISLPVDKKHNYFPCF